MGHSGPVTGVWVTPDGHRAVSRSDDMTLKVWDLDNGKLLTTLNGFIYKITALAVMPGGCRIIFGSEDEALRIWDINNGKELWKLKKRIYLCNLVSVRKIDFRREVRGICRLRRKTSRKMDVRETLQKCYF